MFDTILELLCYFFHNQINLKIISYLCLKFQIQIKEIKNANFLYVSLNMNPFDNFNLIFINFLIFKFFV